MKHRLFYVSMGLITAASVSAQETYLNATVSTEELNGTARYVGMGGAMDALGADISTIGTNPAGIGLFRSSQAKVSFGFVSQEGGKSFGGADKTNMSFDQAGFVYATRTSKRSFLNFAFNYHKSANFDYILSAAGTLDGASQNKLTYLKASSGLFQMNRYGSGNDIYFVGIDNQGYDSNLFNTVDYLYTNVLNCNENGLDGYNEASSYTFDRAQTGYVGEYDFNISGNVNDRFYWGLTVGVHDVHYHAYSQYGESLLSYAYDDNGASAGSVTMTDERRITGTGVDIKAGVIFRPIEESPLRIGLSVASPTWYDLTSSSYTTLTNNAEVLNPNTGTYDLYGLHDYGEYPYSYDFCLSTPWRFGLSLGTTVGDYLAIGAGYEYADYSNLDTRFKDDGYYDDWSSTSSDKAMNSATEQTLKGVTTVKVGAEFRPDPSIAVRMGYNYVSPMYRENAEKGLLVNSSNNAVTSTTDYTNWEATNRITAGLGYTIDKFSIDLAYQYSAQSGKFHPFVDYEYSGDTNYADAVKVENNRHQLLLTLGYRF